MHRDPLVSGADDPEEARRRIGRAWGIVLGAWVALFVFLALVAAPLLFSLCERATS